MDSATAMDGSKEQMGIRFETDYESAQPGRRQCALMAWPLLVSMLMACLPLGATDLVFPQGQYMSLTSGERRAYARLDFTVGLQVWPARIVKADGSAWKVPATPVPSVWRSPVFPSIYVPPGQYVVEFAGPQFWPTACDNETMQVPGGRCVASCGYGYSASTEPAEMTFSWNAAAGERYQLSAKLIVRAPRPTIVWAGVWCRYQITIPSGSGIAELCLQHTSARRGSEAAPHCSSVQYSFGHRPTGGLPGALSAGSGAAPQAQPAPAGEAASPPAAPEPAWLTLTSTPPGAEIRLNGTLFGTTPARLKLVPAEYTIDIELAGFATWKRTLKLASGSAITVDAELAPASPPASAAQF